MNYDIKKLAEKTEMSVKLVKHYLEKYQLEDSCENCLVFDSFSEKHVKMLKIIKEINKSKFFNQPLASYYIQQVKTDSYNLSFPDEGEETLRRVSSLIREIKEI